jgi:hypothetical protein
MLDIERYLYYNLRNKIVACVTIVVVHFTIESFESLTKPLIAEIGAKNG